ncbi:HlyD family secretion protein [Flaviaesturariibacter aridisoli]|uniref:HlyD family secretion protein n=1 Tax=Flaviaesturariibacter aridisoli TaxID=2545761 RepID=A0A4R4EAC9_9BACT|nr:HlyD family secretion protein [Flaviaesturariibacter aridisoli]TCZ74828.1 HlyD family secretion protein [Flaviaesturariibacter aridisoli]
MAQEVTTTTTEQAPKKRSKVFLIVLILLVLAGGAFGLTKYNHAQHHEETDNAHVEANISPVIPRIGGYIADVRVKDNQHVKKGDTLIVLDDRDLRLKVQQAEAALANAQSALGVAEASTRAAKANIGTSRAAVETIDAQIETARVNVWRTQKDYERYANLVQDHSVTQQQYEQALAAKQTAERQLRVLQEQRQQAASQTSAVGAQSGATGAQVPVASTVIQQRRVDVENAKLNLSYAVVTAPEDGLVSRVTVQSGQFVQPGQQLFAIVLNNQTWIVGNFKETQLDKMKVGQKVIVHADAFPGHDIEARVASFSPGTGSSFALLPPDNATGNFVKVVQRVPVRIEFANPQDPLLQQLRAGMNVELDVHLD